MPSNEYRSSESTTTQEDKYRLYIDESGDHVFGHLDHPGHRYLCLLGCWFQGADYRIFHDELARFKQRHIPHNPDEPVILHREDIINRRKAFWRLRNRTARQTFDEELLELVRNAKFSIIAVVIDKKALLDQYPTPGHPYNLAIGFMLQRYCGYLNHINRQGDVMAESRGGREDRLLKDSYTRVYLRGAWMTKTEFFQRVLTACQLKVKPKSSNIGGLQLADLLAHPVRQAILIERQRIIGPLSEFAAKISEVSEGKFNRHLYKGTIEGYGKVFFPK